MERTATWVLTDTRGLFVHTFTCSECGRIVTATKHFNSEGHYDMQTTVKELMEDYPYCHCGAKMKKDSQIKGKMTQMKNVHKLVAKDTWVDGHPVREKTFWKVDEKVEVD